MATVTVQVKIDLDPMIEGIEKVLTDNETMLEVNKALAEWCDPYVPYRTGALSKNITIDADGVTYNQPYAYKNYYGVDIPHRKTYHPLATAKWDEAMMADHGDEFNQVVSDIIARRLQELNG